MQISQGRTLVAVEQYRPDRPMDEQLKPVGRRSVNITDGTWDADYHLVSVTGGTYSITSKRKVSKDVVPEYFTLTFTPDGKQIPGEAKAKQREGLSGLTVSKVKELFDSHCSKDRSSKDATSSYSSSSMPRSEEAKTPTSLQDFLPAHAAIIEAVAFLTDPKNKETTSQTIQMKQSNLSSTTAKILRYDCRKPIANQLKSFFRYLTCNITCYNFLITAQGPVLIVSQGLGPTYQYSISILKYPLRTVRGATNEFSEIKWRNLKADIYIDELDQQMKSLGGITSKTGLYANWVSD